MQCEAGWWFQEGMLMRGEGLERRRRGVLGLLPSLLLSLRWTSPTGQRVSAVWPQAHLTCLLPCAFVQWATGTLLDPSAVELLL